jgi:hypothetical protein
MSESHLLSIGFIPVGHSGGTVACGDPDSSGTREITIEIGEDAAMNLEAGLSMPTANASFFTEGCPLWALGEFLFVCFRISIVRQGDVRIGLLKESEWTSREGSRRRNLLRLIRPGGERRCPNLKFLS